MFVTNALADRPDEGTLRLAREVATVSQAAGASVVSLDDTTSALARKAMVDPDLLRALRAKPGTPVVYLPTQSLTLGTLVRAAVLRLAGRADVTVIATQPRPLPGGMARWSRVAKGLRVLTPSVAVLDQWPGSRFLPMGIDLDAFRPVAAARKAALRTGHGVPADAKVVLHVGHLTANRNLGWLADTASPDVTVIVVGSERFGADAAVRQKLEAAGVDVRTGYVADIAELYQLADVYAFPVLSDEGAIGIPLSVLEAMACGLPVVTTPFGGLPRMVQPGDGVWFAADQTAFDAAVGQALAAPAESVQTRRTVSRFTWAEALSPVTDLLQAKAVTAR
ncbi:MAG: hypothetical protein QOK43_17 [Acidimicrobiaceae bacterium]|nr:hypothetical protein [Acidimicrobiaceae bacterium]